MSKLNDVIVVGAGPAGANAARLLAMKGLDVLVVEKHPWPRGKLCGGGLTPKAYQQVGSEVEDLVRVKVDSVYLRAGKVGPFHIRSSTTAIWMVDRKEFDSRLLQCARDAGARFDDGQQVRSVEPTADGVAVFADGETHRGRVVIGADGFDSVIAKGLGLRSRRNAEYFLALQTQVRPQRDSLGNTAIVDFCVPRGYGWVFPKGEHLSVGVGSSDARLFKELPWYLDRFVEASGLAEAPKKRCRGHKIPFGGARERLNTANALLVGDAAGMADPLFGEGISYALKSGEMAAEAVADYLGGRQESLDVYTERVHKTIVKDLRALRATAFFVYRFPGIAVRLLGSSRRLQDVVAGVVSGERSLGKVWE